MYIICANCIKNPIKNRLKILTGNLITQLSVLKKVQSYISIRHIGVAKQVKYVKNIQKQF